MAAPRRRWTIDGVSSSHAMSHADAAWLRMDRPTNPMVINALLWFDEVPDWDRLRQAYVERIVEHFPRFRQVARPGGPLGGPHWEDDPLFDPADHVHRLSLPAPHDRDALRELVADLASAPLDHGRPLWEVYLIDDFGGGAAVLTRVHHAIADGIALSRAMLSVTDAADSEAGIGDGAHASALGQLVHGGLSALAHPRRTAARALSDVGTLSKLLLSTEPSHLLKSEGHIGHRIAWSDPIDLWRIKRVARTYRVTVNDVLMAALSGALRDRVVAAGNAPERLHALVPLNLRPLDEPVPPDLGNHFGLVLTDLPLDVDDEIDRLREVNRAMDAIKRSDEGVLTFGILETMGAVPAAVEQRLIEFFTSKASMVVTNVVGPGAPISLAGTPVAGMLVWAPCAGDLRMTVSLFSYAGKVTAGFLTDAGVLPDPQPLADAFRAELLALGRRSRRMPA